MLQWITERLTARSGEYYIAVYESRGGYVVKISKDGEEIARRRTDTLQAALDWAERESQCGK
jgi:hypothetical protein